EAFMLSPNRRLGLAILVPSRVVISHSPHPPSVTGFDHLLDRDNSKGEVTLFLFCRQFQLDLVIGDPFLRENVDCFKRRYALLYARLKTLAPIPGFFPILPDFRRNGFDHFVVIGIGSRPFFSLQRGFRRFITGVRQPIPQNQNA
ncbi:MAG TPA: hypothetical protein VF480_08585, partial [Verrucomicrobiae bacterium]